MPFADCLNAGQVCCPAPSHVVMESLATLVDLIDCGLCACDAKGELLHVNRAAHREFESGAVLTVIDGQVRSLCGSQRELTVAVREAASMRKSRMLLIGDARHRLAIVIGPILSGGSAESAESPVLLMLGRRTLCSPLVLEMLVSRHDLTQMEARVFCSLLGNRSPRQIANAHQVSLPTVRTQIQSLREKMGVHSVEELLLFAASIPPFGTRVASLVQ